MKVVSFKNVIVGAARVAHFDSDNVKANPERAAAIVSHPQGTVVDLDDDEALRLIDIEAAVAWVPSVHGDTPAAIAEAMEGCRARLAKMSR